MEAKCANCSANFEVVGTGVQTCPWCNAKLALGAPPPLPNESRAPRAAVEQGEVLNPWDSAPEPSMGALISTAKHSLLAPAPFFKATQSEGGHWRATLYYWLFQGGALLLGLLESELFPASDNSIAEFEAMVGLPYRTVMLAMLLFLPLMALTSAAFAHLSAMFFAGVRGNFMGTYKALTYSAAPSILNVVPVIGSFCGGVWSLVLYVIGLREQHRLTTGRAVLVLAGPILLVLCLSFVAILVLGISSAAGGSP